MSRDYDSELNDSALGEAYKKNFDYWVSMKVIERFLPYMRSSRCLEIGCYDGTVTQELSRRYEHVLAIDASANALKIAKSKCLNESNVIIKHENLDQLSNLKEDDLCQRFFTNPIDVILMNIVEHLDDSKKSLKTLYENIATGSRIFVQVPNVDSLSRQIASRMEVIDTVDKITEFEKQCGHRENFSFDSLDFLIRSINFRVKVSFGVGLKTLSSGQFDKALQLGVIEQAYIDAIFSLDQIFPSMSGSICLVAEK